MNPFEAEPRHPLAVEFRKALGECEELYRAGAREYAALHPDMTPDAAADFLERMLDLHRGLVIKVFVEIAQADWRWSPGELMLARDLFEHVWGQQLDGDQLREGLSRVLGTVQLRWDSLLGPFERLRPLRKRSAELQALVLRMANIVAKVDGQLGPEESRQLQWIAAELRRVLEHIPLAPDVPSRPAAASQQRTLQETAEAVRSRYDLKATPSAKKEDLTTRRSLAEVTAELEQLIGLDNIKQEVHGLVNFLTIQKEREKHGLAQTKVSLHSVFSGNAGTGKTTVARLYGSILGAMGVLAKGHLVETDRSGLVAEYAGQTGPKTNQRIDQALDGVLFIDEAYSLVAESGEDPYGAEALQTLLKRMEDDRSRLVVILAGYPRPLDRLLKTNPGLLSRFTRTFAFADYTAVELGRIFETMCRQNEYELPGRTRAKLLLGFQAALDARGENFGNGRLARNVFEMAIRRLANRIARVTPLTKEILTTLEPDDIILENVPAAVWDKLHSDELRFRVECPGCRHASRVSQKFLGQKVQCRRCQHEFHADWGDVVTDE